MLLRIQREAAVAAFGHIFPRDQYPFPDEAIGDGWRAALDDPGIDVYLAEIDAEAVGLVSVGQGFLRSLFVVPVYWGQGVGSTLHDYGLDRLRGLNFLEARLWTLAESASARRFYEKRRWSETGRTRVVPFPPNPLDVEYVRQLHGA